MTHQKLKLFCRAFTHQLLWFLPLTILGYYIHTHLQAWCDSYFGVVSAQQVPSSLSSQSAIAPVSFFDSFRSFMIETTTSAKLYMLSSVSTLVAHLGQLILDIFGIMIFWKWIKAIRCSYQTQGNHSDLVQAIISKLQPEIRALRQEVAQLSAQLNKKGKNS